MNWLKKLWSYMARYSIGQNSGVRRLPIEREEKCKGMSEYEIVNELIKKLDGAKARNKDGT